MNSFRDKLRQSGYDAEESYFHKKEQELIQKTRDANAKAKDHLRLIKGEANGVLNLPPRQQKKAA